jgi:hypothetical protein
MLKNIFSGSSKVLLKHSARTYFCIMLAVLLSETAFSQVKYSNDPSYLLSKTEFGNVIFKPFRSAYPDTSVKNLQNYSGRNYMGNLGLPTPAYMLSYRSKPLGFSVYDLPFGNDIIQRQQVEYFRTKGPYASLTGIAGSKQEQNFRLTFTNTLKNRLNFTLRFNRFGSLGYYQKQQTFTNNFYTSQNWFTKDKRFGFYSYFLFNKVKYQENGGIKYDTIFRDQPTITKDLLAVNISNAKHTIRETYAAVNPWLKLNKGDPDSVKFSHYIDYKLSYTGNYYWYTDANSGSDGFYNTFYLDTVKTNDSTHLRQIVNRANYTIKMNRSGLGAYAGYAHEHNIYHQFADSIFDHQLAYASVFFDKPITRNDSLSINRNKFFSTRITYSSVLSGPNSGDMKLELNSELNFRLNEKGLGTKKTNRIYLSILSEQRHPDMIYNYYYSNHFRWTNSYKPVEVLQAKLGLINNITGLSANIIYQNINNYLYFDSTAAPKQSKAIVSNWQFNLNYNYVFFKHLGIRLNLYYQKTNQSSIVRIPPGAATGSLYYTGNLFKNNLQLQVGLQGEYYQAFKAYAYMPATNQFYIQNRYSVGEYPFVDVYLNARIRPVQFFVKMENVLYGLAGSNYYFVPGYIQPDRALRFGLTWLFFD